ncbi:trypsin-like peptidase domain-containing protein [Citrobacter portucalensis]|uniref:Trypsin-like peptidase domain-containing protein n=1 Tax=Citrobacter portucalensis TaxID=1639133 RepID=A0AAW7LKY9_9ENTR|nr:trypsin-like peptidase domain-containing protein [Citrobacter portucalensis]MDN4366804.1 trypsin-like peptidase domain-containing protein [Citrobacter portucalensis]
MLIPSLFYPYPSVIDLFANAVEMNLISQLTEKWERSFVSFHAPKTNSKKELLAVGSGFLMMLGDTPFIVTASHVIDEIKDLDVKFFTIEKQFYPLENTNIHFNEEQDYAFIELPRDLLLSERGFILFSDIARKELSPTSTMIISGFPASKNKYHKDKPFKGLQRLNFAFHHFEYNTSNEELHFPFDSRPGKGTGIKTESISTFTSMPSLSGMSGAPVLQVMDNINTGALTLRVVGIFKEHRSKTEKCLVASTFSHFADETNNIFKIKSPYG